MKTLISAEGLWKSYVRKDQPATPVLRGASLSINRGDVVAIVGPSGAGKSTLLHIMATLDSADSGSVIYHLSSGPVDVTSAPRSAVTAIRRDSIGVVFQFHHLLPEFTAVENVCMPALVRGVAKGDVLPRATELLKKVGMSHRAHHAPTELSGGEQQRIAIARAIMNNPDVIFADEPTGNLDTENADTVANLLFSLRNELGTACVIATHSDALAQRATRIVRMVDGVCFEDVRG